MIKVRIDCGKCGKDAIKTDVFIAYLKNKSDDGFYFIHHGPVSLDDLKNLKGKIEAVIKEIKGKSE